jgi:hypothetical protein
MPALVQRENSTIRLLLSVRDRQKAVVGKMVGENELSR